MKLPVVDALPELGAALATHGKAVLVAPPGSGKTTVVPPWLVDAGLVPRGEVVVLQPRRVAARSVARHLAALRNEEVGESVGYQVRFERRVSARTRIRIVTEGILTAWLQRDPSLEGVGAVVVDEFHERSVHADLGLAFLREVATAWRDDLKIIVMSATMAAEPVSLFLGDAPIVRAEGRMYPIDLQWLDAASGGALSAPKAVDRAIDAVLGEARRGLDGDVLVFMPGAREIDTVVRALEGPLGASGIEVLPLHGRLPAEQQDRAVRGDAAGRRRVIVATNVAETSLTIPGVRVVVDSGLARVSRWDPAVGSTRLELERISRASADQRMGRAGRLGPGRAIRLWSKYEDDRLDAFETPEIHRVDPARLVLELRQWGVATPASFAFFEAPQARALEEAEARLGAMGAIDRRGLTTLGRAMTRMPLEPRAAAALLLARRLPELPKVALVLAADAEGALHDDASLLNTRDLPPRVVTVARQLEQAARGEDADIATAPTAAAAWLQAHADRVAVRRADDTYQLAGGRRAQATTREPVIVILELDGGRRGEAATSRVRSFVPVAERDLVASPLYIERHTVIWDEREARVVGVKQRAFGSLVLEEKPAPLTDRAKAAELLAAWGERNLGLLVGQVDARHQQRLARLIQLGRLYPELGLPVGRDGWVQRCLPALCEDLSSAQQLLDKLDGRFGAALDASISYDVKQKLQRLMPESIEIPSGREARLEWQDDGPPVLAAKVQELFGWDAGPSLADGRLPVVFHLLDPGGKPLQVTRDLASFWRETWKAVRSEMRSRYPKHHWPEDPLGEVASTRTTARAYRARNGGS
jgi:ATP-dependent helicase HrpB